MQLRRADHDPHNTTDRLLSVAAGCGLFGAGILFHHGLTAPFVRAPVAADLSAYILATLIAIICAGLAACLVLTWAPNLTLPLLLGVVLVAALGGFGASLVGTPPIVTKYTGTPHSAVFTVIQTRRFPTRRRGNICYGVIATNPDYGRAELCGVRPLSARRCAMARP